MSFKKGDIVISWNNDLYRVIEYKKITGVNYSTRHTIMVSCFKTGEEKELAAIMLSPATAKEVAQWRIKNDV